MAGNRTEALAALLCLSLVVWSTLPSISHVPMLVETLQEHAQMIAEHGHSHGFEEDLVWALHGHGHDAADHDHSQALAVRGDVSDPILGQSALPFRPSQEGPYGVFRIERPPRA